MGRRNLHQPVPCSVCGAIVSRSRSSLRRWKSAACSRACAGKLTGGKNFKGGRIERDGYVLLYLPNHPYADQKGYVREHRFVVEQNIGRKLTPVEVVHHINHDSLDNKIENLLVTTSSEHASYHHRGQAHSQAKLTDTLVREIRLMYDSGSYTQRALCELYGISKAQMCMIVNRKAWKHLI